MTINSTSRFRGNIEKMRKTEKSTLEKNNIQISSDMYKKRTLRSRDALQLPEGQPAERPDGTKKAGQDYA